MQRYINRKPIGELRWNSKLCENTKEDKTVGTKEQQQQRKDEAKRKQIEAW